MNTNTLKRRRPYGSLETGLEGPAQYLAQTELDFSSLPFDLQELLEQTAASYGLTGSRLHYLACNDQARKRQRSLHGYPMSFRQQLDDASQDAAGKSLMCEHQGQMADSTGPSNLSFQSGNLQYVAQGLNTLRLAICPGCDTRWDMQGYESLPEQVSSSPWDPNEPYTMEKPPSTHMTGEASYVSPTDAPDPSSALDVNSCLGDNITPNYQTMHETIPAITQTVGNDMFFNTDTSVAFYNTATAGTDAMMASNQNEVLGQEQTMPAQPASTSYERAMGNVDIASPMMREHFSDVLPSATSSGFSSVQTYGIPESFHSEPNMDALKQSSNLILVPPNQKAHTAKRGPFKDQVKREQTAQTRRLGSCIRCRMQRIRCRADESTPAGSCLTCKSSTAKIWRLPCLRVKITDVKLFKPGQVSGHEWTQRWKDSIVDDISNWESQEEKMIQVSEGYTKHRIQLRVRRFRPQKGDELCRSWASPQDPDVKQKVELPPYAVVDLQDIQETYYDYIRRCVADYECFINVVKAVLKSDGPESRGLKESHTLETYRMAWLLNQKKGPTGKEGELLQKALELWVAIRLTTTSTVLVGAETLGIDVMPQGSHQPGKRPLPPVMGKQIDTILRTNIQTELRRQMLEKLQKMLQENKQTTWLTTYLVTFILLHNVSLITNHDHGYAKKHGMGVRWARVNDVKEYIFGANIILAYFHYCNKGLFPFSEKCREQDVRALAELDDDAMVFVRRTRQWAIQHEEEWWQLRQSKIYENGYFWVSQLYTHGWQPELSDPDAEEKRGEKEEEEEKEENAGNSDI